MPNLLFSQCNPNPIVTLSHTTTKTFNWLKTFSLYKALRLYKKTRTNKNMVARLIMVFAILPPYLLPLPTYPPIPHTPPTHPSCHPRNQNHGCLLCARRCSGSKFSACRGLPSKGEARALRLLPERHQHLSCVVCPGSFALFLSMYLFYLCFGLSIYFPLF
jgi:hypothetical protein